MSEAYSSPCRGSAIGPTTLFSAVSADFQFIGLTSFDLKKLGFLP